VTTTPAIVRLLPRFPEPDTQPFWEATKEHKLIYQVCNKCKGIVFYPRRHCTHCLSLDLSWHESKGEGTIYTFSIVRRSRHPSFADRVPYVVAWVDFDEGFRMLTNIVNVDDVDTIAIGQRVRLCWEDHESVSLPKFERS
jgi:uncharacterized OB-fold protein